MELKHRPSLIPWLTCLTHVTLVLVSAFGPFRGVFFLICDQKLIEKGSLRPVGSRVLESAMLQKPLAVTKISLSQHA